MSFRHRSRIFRRFIHAVGASVVVGAAAILSTLHLLVVDPGFMARERILPFSLYPVGTTLFLALALSIVPLGLVVSSLLASFFSNRELELPIRSYLWLKVGSLLLLTLLARCDWRPNWEFFQGPSGLANMHGCSDILCWLVLVVDWPHFKSSRPDFIPVRSDGIRCT